MTAIDMKSETLSFVRYDREFLDASYLWLQDQELCQLINATPTDRDQQLAWFQALPERQDYLIWGIKFQGKPVGACGLEKIDHPTKHAEYWGYIASKELWGKGLGRQIVEYCLHEARKINLQKVWLTVSVNNLRAISLYYKTGFTLTEYKDNNFIMEKAVNHSNLDLCRLINFPQVADLRGNLSFIEGGRHVPFSIRRVYYLYDVPGGAERGGHAHKALQQVIIAMSGSFDIVLDDGQEKRKFHMNRSYYGLYIPTMLWRELNNFSSGAVCLVLASTEYDENDYYRDYQGFLQALT